MKTQLKFLALELERLDGRKKLSAVGVVFFI